MKNTEGYIVTGGNIFHHENAFVKMEIINWTDGSAVQLFVKTATDLVSVSRYLDLNGIQNKLHENKCLRQGEGSFPISIKLLWQSSEGRAKKVFEEFSKKIRVNESESRFVDVTKD